MKKIFSLLTAILFSLFANAQWDTLNTGTKYKFNSIAFSSMDTGAVAGYDSTSSRGKMMWTTDGGATWTNATFSLASVPVLHALAFPVAQMGWVVGDSGYVAVSNASVSGTWFQLPFFTNRNLYSIAFYDQLHILIGGADGVLFKTNDGGFTWDTLSTGSSLPIRTILPDVTHGIYIAGDGGFIANSPDSGNTWTTLSNPFFGFFNVNGVAIIPHTPDDYVMAVGNSGMMSYGDLSVNAPTLNWTTNGYGNNINAILSQNGSIIMCGSGGMILRSSDGFNWSNDVVAGVTQNLTAICYGGDTTAYICGAAGRVLKSHVDVSGVAVLHENILQASAFPNPFENELNVVVDLQNSSAVQIDVTDVSGRIIFSENKGEQFAGKNIFQLNGISDLSSGIYFVRVTTNNGVETLPVVKK